LAPSTARSATAATPSPPAPSRLEKPTATCHVRVTAPRSAARVTALRRTRTTPTSASPHRLRSRRRCRTSRGTRTLAVTPRLLAGEPSRTSRTPFRARTSAWRRAQRGVPITRTLASSTAVSATVVTPFRRAARCSRARTRMRLAAIWSAMGTRPNSVAVRTG
jgi:hypothetical protein